MKEFLAFRLHQENGQEKPVAKLDTLSVKDLSEGNVVIKTAYASLNYKDALAYKGIGKIIKSYPRVPGIDLTGTVVQSKDPNLTPGMEVMVHGFGIGESVDGGFAQVARVNSAWVMPLPRGVSLLEAATLGVAGYTAGMAIDWLERCDVHPENGPIVVTGATGGVGSVAIHLLNEMGYDVVAMTGKSQASNYLKALGATQVQSPPDLSNIKPLSSAQWAGAIDSVGGELLSWLLSTTQQEGAVAAFGNAGGYKLNTTVFPFILRGVKLLGINVKSPMSVRQRIWQNIFNRVDNEKLAKMRQIIQLESLAKTMDDMLNRKTQGRIVVEMN